MRITKMEIQNYRSCLTTTFSPHPHLSVLIGPNGSGKTNILNAIQLLKKLTEDEEMHHFAETPPTAECRLKVWFDLNERTVILTASVHTYTDETNADVVVNSRQQWYLKDFTGSAKRVKIPLWLSQYFGTTRSMRRHALYYYQQRALHRGSPRSVELPDEAIRPLTQIAQHLSEMRYYSASQFTNPSHCPVSFEIEKEGQESRGFALGGHAKFLFDLYSAFRLQSNGYIQFFDIVGPSGIGLVDNIGFKDILTSSIDYSVRSGGKIKERKREKSLIIPQFTIGKHELSPNQLSEGTFKTITLLFYLITEASSILLVEEPEVCVHHGLLSSIIELIKAYSDDKQIVVSTHSDFVLDQVAPENVYKTARIPDRGTTITQITKAMAHRELSALRDYLDSEGNLGEYWRHGALET